MTISRCFAEMPDLAMNWGDVAAMVRDWNGPFCLKGVLPVADARRAVVIGCTGIILSQHGKRQLDGARRAFDQLAEVVVAVGDRIDVMMDDGSRRVSHVRKALSLGGKSGGDRAALPLRAGGGCAGGGGTGGGGTGADAVAGGPGAGHAADGVPVGQQVVAPQPAVSLTDPDEGGSAPRLRLPPGYLSTENEEESQSLAKCHSVIWR